MRPATGLSLLLVGLSPWPASAHAILVRAMPLAGARIATAPATIALVFSEALEVRFTKVVVTDSAGLRVDRDDLKAAGDGKTVVLGVGTLKSGKYHVAWRAVSIDTHRSQGNYGFSVGN